MKLPNSFQKSLYLTGSFRDSSSSHYKKSNVRREEKKRRSRGEEERRRREEKRRREKKKCKPWRYAWWGCCWCAEWGRYLANAHGKCWEEYLFEKTVREQNNKKSKNRRLDGVNYAQNRSWLKRISSQKSVTLFIRAKHPSRKINKNKKGRKKERGRAVPSLSTTPLMKRNHSGMSPLAFDWIKTLRQNKLTPGSEKNQNN